MNEKEQTLEVLRTARDVVLADEGSWCQGDYAVSETGASRMAHESDAVAFCRMGAVKRAAGLLGVWPRCVVEARSALYETSGPPELRNDDPDTTYSSTIDDFDLAIKKLEES